MSQLLLNMNDNNKIEAYSEETIVDSE